MKFTLIRLLQYLIIARLEQEASAETNRPTVQLRDLNKVLLDVDIDSHSRKRKRDHKQTSQGFVEGMDPASDDDGWLDEHDPEVEQDLLYKSSDDQILTVADDVHAPQLPC
jgi:hypothetical protein